MAIESAESHREPKGQALHTKILIGLLVGAVLGTIANAWAGTEGPRRDNLDWAVIEFIEPLGKIFLRLIFMVVLPLVFSALTLGILSVGDVRKLGTLGLRALAFTFAFSFTAVIIGVVLVNLIQPGNALPPEKREALRLQYESGAEETMDQASQAKPLRQVLLDIIPENPLQEMVGALDGSSKGDGMLAVMFFALAFGVALTFVESNRAEALIRVLEGVFDVTMVIISFAMRIAPYGVACLLFAITSRLGGDILITLIWFVITVLIGLTIHMVVVYSLMLRYFANMSPVFFFRAVREAMLTAFATSSSNATLPTALKVAEQELKLPRSISTFVLTVGATGNQNGTALYEGVVVLFLAQVFGVELTLLQQFAVVMLSVLAGVGTAGVPGGSLPLIVIVLRTVNVPGEGIAIILGIDRLLDMCRTVLNVTGDLALAACVANVPSLAEVEVEVDQSSTATSSPSQEDGHGLS